jgi:hypothetical protein
LLSTKFDDAYLEVLLFAVLSVKSGAQQKAKVEDLKRKKEETKK